VPEMGHLKRIFQGSGKCGMEKYVLSRVHQSGSVKSGFWGGRTILINISYTFCSLFLFLEIWTNINFNQDHKSSRSSHVRLSVCPSLGMLRSRELLNLESWD